MGVVSLLKTFKGISESVDKFALFVSPSVRGGFDEDPRNVVEVMEVFHLIREIK